VISRVILSQCVTSTCYHIDIYLNVKITIDSSSGRSRTTGGLRSVSLGYRVVQLCDACLQHCSSSPIHNLMWEFLSPCAIRYTLEVCCALGAGALLHRSFTPAPSCTGPALASSEQDIPSTSISSESKIAGRFRLSHHICYLCLVDHVSSCTVAPQVVTEFRSTRSSSRCMQGVLQSAADLPPPPHGVDLEADAADRCPICGKEGLENQSSKAFAYHMTKKHYLERQFCPSNRMCACGKGFMRVNDFDRHLRGAPHSCGPSPPWTNRQVRDGHACSGS